jgi:hypothetical protein
MLNLLFLDFCISVFRVNKKKVLSIDNWIWFIVLVLGLAYSLVVVTFHTSWCLDILKSRLKEFAFLWYYGYECYVG